MLLRRFIRDYYSPAAASSLLTDVRYIHILASAAAAALMAILWQDLPLNFITNWFSALFCVQLLLTAIASGFRRHGCKDNPHYWLASYSLFSALGTFIWGCLSLTFGDYLNLWQQILVLLLLFVLLSMSVPLLSRFFPLFCLNILATALPLVAVFSLHSGFAWQLLFAGLLLLLCTITLLIRARIEALRHLDAEKKDRLTGLLNRRECLTLLTRSDIASNGLLVCRLQNYSAICDAFGNAAGNAALQHCANSLRYISEQQQLASRISDNEFALMLPTPHPQQWRSKAQQLLRQIGSQLSWGEHLIALDCGLGLSNVAGLTAETALRQAQLAAATARPDNSVVPYHPELWDQLQRDIYIRSALRRPELYGELSLHYQLKQSLTEEGDIAGAEALLRWQHPELGTVTPDEFIAIAEQSGTILDIGDWVIQQAVDGLLRIPGESPFSIAVNVSMEQFTSDRLIDSLTAAVAQLPPHRSLEIEITESMMMLDSDQVRATLQKISDLGVKIALDDFGTGYSSLQYLADLHIDTLKIDRNFVAGMLEQPKQRAVVKIIIEMAQALDIAVVAEGVELANQLSLLKQWQCDAAQGFFISRPQPLEQLLQALDDRRAVDHH